MVDKHFADNIFKQAWAHFSSQLNDFKILSNMNHSIYF